MAETSDTARPTPATVMRLGGSASLLHRILQGVMAASILVAAAVLVTSLILAAGWLQLPFPGALYGGDLTFTSAAPLDTGEQWSLYEQGTREGDQLIAVNGLPVRVSSDVEFILRGFLPGQQIPMSVKARDGSEHTLDVRLSIFGPAERTAYLILPTVLALLFLALSIWAFFTVRTDPAGRAFAVLAAALSVASGSFFDLFTTHALLLAWTAGLAFAGAALLELAFLFPKEWFLARRFSWLHWLVNLAALVSVVIAVSSSSAQDPALKSTVSAAASYGLLALGALSYLFVNVYQALSAKSPIVKAQARMIAPAVLIAGLPLAAWWLFAAEGSRVFTPYLALPAAVLPLTIAYAMRRFRFTESKEWFRRGLVYVLLSILILGAYALIVSGATLLIGTAAPTTSPLWIGVAAFLLAVVLEPVRTRLQSLTDRIFFRGQQAESIRARSLANDLSNALSLDDVGRVVRKAAETTVAPTAVHVFVYDGLSDQFAALRDDTNRPSTDVRFAAQGALARYFARERLPLFLEGKSIPAGLQEERSRLRLLDAQLLLSLSGREQQVGWLALGPRRSGKPYAPGDMAFLAQLADQTSIALNRVQTVENLERRIQEMNALTRVAQGVNITLTFDDVLELVYAQTSQIVPGSDFHITLYNRQGDYYYLAFAVENSERLTGRENSPLPPNTGLAPEVVRRGRPIITQDYSRECQGLGITPPADPISAWMGVPLNAGAEAIGALSIGSRRPGAAYTRHQLESLQAIADQTAGAIVKSRLLRETQQRAAQLGKLNDVTRRFASTLEMDPLRQEVIDGAVSILDCEAGLFYLLDQPGGELIVRASSGSIPKEIVGQHVPVGTGNASRAAATGEPSIQNNLVPGSGAHFLDRDPSAWVPKTSLAVPLQVQDSIVGVLELLNRRDAAPFVEEDRSLLMAFTGQAAVALENVRLYTLTDQELAARVEELSVMQRIDRELNASLEMDRAMRITLEWALRQSGVEAGLIGLLEDGRLRIVTEMGYGPILGSAMDQTLALTLPGFQPAVDTGLPQRVRFEAGGTGGFLPGADHQVVIPIRREATVIGLLVLESTRPALEDLGFLSRLSDHAAIAISNAQLYDEVQRANIAKSDFVSLVAHELKNPMTSIKGYTELLAAGAVGAVNEMQANFLNTIRSNTERMSTLVSDLNDNSKIEAGRLRLDFKSVDLVEMIEEVLRSSRRQTEEKKQTVQMELSEQLPQVWADRTRLGQVFTNLVSNANKYTPEGGTLAIGAEPSANHWDPAGAGRVVHVWLRDSGIGISPEDQQRVFQKFFRSEDPRAREVPGAGLGLNITRSLVEMQGGRIWFESEYRHGTTFHFTVPVAEA